MAWAQSLDTAVLHWINPALRNSIFDVLMPFLSGNPFFLPAALLGIGFLLWKGGVRGRVCVLMLLAAIALGDGVICGSLKELIGRPRPFHVITDLHVPDGVGRTDSGSMPSSHAANWFAATIVFFWYYRRSVRFMLPLALLVSFSRLYNGVHYPSDVLAGAILGLGSGAAALWTCNWLWQQVGQRWFPLWWQQLPNLLDPTAVAARPQAVPDAARIREQQWLRLGYLVIFAMLALNLAYIASGRIGLSGDEAYQWVWSKHLALSYYSKPLLIAVTQFLGTSLWGDNVFGVRFFSPVISAVMSLAILRFLAQVVNARVAFWLVAIFPAVPLLAVGSILMTIDPLSVMFWTLAMLAGWRAVQDSSTTLDWVWVGLWMGLGLLSKYTSLYQLLCWVVFFVLWPPARQQLRRPGPYVALLVNALCSLPILIWNAQNNWITVRHVSEGGHFNEGWAFTAANIWHGLTNFTTDFVVSEIGLQNPFLFLPVAWAACVFWRRGRNQPLLIYFFSMGAPVFLGHLIFTIHSRVLPNWIAPSVLPLFCLGVIYWEQRWREGFRPIRYWLIAGLVFGAVASFFMRDSSLPAKFTGRSLPPRYYFWHRVEGWQETAQAVDVARHKLLAEGKPVFIIGHHYGITGELSFQLPEARASIRDNPLVYYRTSPVPDNQFYFWPGYLARKGENALYVEELGYPEGETSATPALLLREFESVTPLPRITINCEGRPVRYLQISECRGLR